SAWPSSRSWKTPRATWAGATRSAPTSWTRAASRTCVPAWKYPIPRRSWTATWTLSSRPASSRASDTGAHGRRPARAGGRRPARMPPPFPYRPHDMTSTETQAPDENRLIAERRAKLDALRQAGPAYPNDFRPDTRAADLHRDCGALDEDALQALGRRARVAGRMMLKRIMGKASFATLQDATGRLQLYLDRGVLGDEAYAAFKSWDIGDIVGAEGEVFKTRMGELSLRVQSLRLLSKSSRPLLDKFHCVDDQELRYLQRYVDLIMSEGTCETFLARSRIISAIRQIMSEADFLEVETPMLHPIPGGAAAKPFITHHNALDMQMFLRIAPELYLKRLIVGGFERVFEINRNFRNEGVSPRHNPEFTMMEFYAAYTDYRWLMDYTESLIRETARRVCGTATLVYQE